MALGLTRTLALWWIQVGSHAHWALQDPDPEHLHQMRVHLRRMRSVLARLKKVLPDPAATRARRTLARIAGRTGDLRNFDVLLPCQDAWMQILPPALVPGGRQVWRHLKLERRRAHHLLVDYLQGKKYREQCAEIDGFLPLLEKIPSADLEAELNKAIRKQYARIATAWPKAARAEEAEPWHRLRIHMKNLRYCLEARMASSDTKAVLKQLKKAQNLLGDFNDLAVQQELLGILADQKWSAEAQQAMGAWLYWLHTEERRAMPQLTGPIAVLCSAENKARLKRITS